MVVFAGYPLTETRVQREAEALVSAGYVVDVICVRVAGEAARGRDGSIDIHRLRVPLGKSSLARQLVGYLSFLVLATIRLTVLHLRHPYRSVQVHNLPDFLVFCALAPKLLGAKVILDLHDLMPEFYAGRFSTNRRSPIERLVRWQERAACAFADHVITVSDHWRRALVERGVDGRRCSVVMNVADERIFQRRAIDSPAERSTFRLLYHGTITPRSGLDLAMRAVALVRAEIPEIRLTIIGRSDHLGELTRLRRELDLEEHVELGIDFVPLEDLPTVIASADVGIVPYRNDVFTDGIVPTKLMEYAAVGIPCIAARTTAIEAYFSDANVLLFEPGNVEDLARCVRELRDPERRSALARRSAIFTERHRWSRVAADYVGLVERVSA